jgi:hypothetical protein
MVAVDPQMARPPSLYTCRTIAGLTDVEPPKDRPWFHVKRCGTLDAASLKGQ